MEPNTETKKISFKIGPALLLAFPILYAVLGFFPGFANPKYCFAATIDGKQIPAADVSFFATVGYAGAGVATLFYLGFIAAVGLGVFGLLASFLPGLRKGKGFGLGALGLFAVSAAGLASSCLLLIPYIEKTTLAAFEAQEISVDYASAYVHANVVFYLYLFLPLVALVWWLGVLLASSKAKRKAD